jgi:S-adenosyl methyltransferase
MTDFTGPNMARIHDCLLGGKDNFAADRELAGRLLEICPSLGDAARGNRASLVTTRVSPSRQAASASRSPGRARLVPVRPWST